MSSMSKGDGIDGRARRWSYAGRLEARLWILTFCNRCRAPRTTHLLAGLLSQARTLESDLQLAPAGDSMLCARPQSDWNLSWTRSGQLRNHFLQAVPSGVNQRCTRQQLRKKRLLYSCRLEARTEDECSVLLPRLHIMIFILDELSSGGP